MIIFLITQCPKHRADQRMRAARAQLEQAILLARNLAFFSQLRAEPLEGPTLRKTCVIPQVIIEAALFFQELGLTRGIKIHLEDRETQYKVEGSPDLLRQVFMNCFFDNAVKYGRRGSTVLVMPRVQKETGFLLVEISGESFAIPVNEREEIFKLGYRSAAAKEHVSSGTGLGLYICRIMRKRTQCVNSGRALISSWTDSISN